jgi:hypothetical protein
MPVVTGEFCTMSRTSLVMSETSVPSSLASVNEALKTFIVLVLPRRILRISLA